MMVKIVNTLGEVKTGVQGEAVYQGKYGQQIRRTRQPKRAIPSQKQLEHRQLYREALTWRKGLSLPNRRYLDGYCIANWIVDGYKIPLPWSRFALKLYLQHIGFVMVEKPVIVYLKPEEKTEEQTQHNNSLGTQYHLYSGQRLTISNRKVSKLGFWLGKVNNPVGDVYFQILKLNDTEIVSKKWGAAADLPSYLEPEYKEVEFDNPVLVNEEVRILSFFDGDTSTSNYVITRYQNTDVKESEYATRGEPPNWIPIATGDTAYHYKYYDVDNGEGGGIDYENSTKGLLHIRHPALLSGEHRRDGKLLESWTNLSNLDDEYLTGQLGVDVFSGDELEFTTIAGVEYAFRVP